MVNGGTQRRILSVAADVIANAYFSKHKIRARPTNNLLVKFSAQKIDRHMGVKTVTVDVNVKQKQKLLTS